MIYYLSLGSNLGDREATLLRACSMIGERIGEVTRRSSFYYSEPWGFSSEHPFCNICIALETALPPLEVLALTQAIERDLGRTEKTLTDATHHPLSSYQDRPVDIDLLRCYDGSREITCQSERLTLPHPLMHERDFVMVPLREITAP